MKYLKKFESMFNDNYINSLIQRTDEYKNSIGKYCILEYRDGETFLVKIIDIDDTDYYAKVDFYDDNYNIETTEATNIAHFMIISSFDTLEEAIEKYEMILKSKNYNL